MNEHTLTQLRSLRLDGMVRAIEGQATSTAASALGFDERFSLLVQREMAYSSMLEIHYDLACAYPCASTMTLKRRPRSV